MINLWNAFVKFISWKNIFIQFFSRSSRRRFFFGCFEKKYRSFTFIKIRFVFHDFMKSQIFIFFIAEKYFSNCEIMTFTNCKYFKYLKIKSL